MKIEEALKYIDNAIDYWVEVSDYDDKQKDVRKTYQARRLIIKLLKKGKS